MVFTMPGRLFQVRAPVGNVEKDNGKAFQKGGSHQVKVDTVSLYQEENSFGRQVQTDVPCDMKGRQGQKTGCLPSLHLCKAVA